MTKIRFFRIFPQAAKEKQVFLCRKEKKTIPAKKLRGNLGRNELRIDRASVVYFTLLSFTGSAGRSTLWTGQFCGLASLKGAVQRISAEDAPKWTV